MDTRNYAAFNAVIFASGSRFHQQFHNVKIEQVGALAQASLDYVTTEDATGSVSYGWKVIHLLKVSGNWKIASEFYTGYPLA
ncbi:hypothetical protein [Burkholderia sp. S171]|uniref:hypothetical protein n=1 Tax=Burkholderia sp. S171 TaxID=1641860 RepID=UPI0020B17058|nr:hypothetical protein [Burkholderia sp. S171]